MLDQPVIRILLEFFPGFSIYVFLIKLDRILTNIGIGSEGGNIKFTIMPTHCGIGKKRQQGRMLANGLVGCGINGGMGRGHEGGDGLDGLAGCIGIGVEQCRFQGIRLQADRQAGWEDKQFTAFGQLYQFRRRRIAEDTRAAAGHVQAVIVKDFTFAVGKNQIQFIRTGRQIDVGIAY